MPKQWIRREKGETRLQALRSNFAEWKLYDLPRLPGNIVRLPMDLLLKYLDGVKAVKGRFPGKKKPVVISITHGIDADGLISQGLVVRKFRKHDVHTYGATHPTHMETLERAVRDAEQTRPEHVIVTDLGINPAKAPQILAHMRRFKELGAKLTYIDHHVMDAPTERELRTIADFVKIGETGKCSSGQLVQEHFLPKDGKAKMLARLSYESDYLKDKSEKTVMLDKAVAGAGSEEWKELVEIIADGRPTHPLVKMAYRDRLKDEARERLGLAKRLEVADANGVPVYLSSSRVFHDKAACRELRGQVLSNGKPDGIFVVFDPDMKQVTAYREGGKFQHINMREVCASGALEFDYDPKVAGGGGHADRASFYYEPPMRNGSHVAMPENVKRRFLEELRKRA